VASWRVRSGGTTVGPVQPLDPSVEGNALETGRLSWLEGRPALRGIAWMALANLLFAGMNVLARVSAASAPWAQIAMIRAATGALIAWTIAKVHRKSLRVTKPRIAWARTLFGTAALLSTFYALSADEVPVGDVVTLSAMSPIFIALLSPLLLGERVGRRIWFAIPLAFLGVAVVVQPTFHIAPTVAGVATLAAVLAALAMISLRRMGSGESSEAIVFHFSSFAALIAGLIALPDFRVPDGAGLLALFGTGLVGGLAQLALTRAYALDRAARLSAISYLGIVFTELLAALFLGETIARMQGIGSILVIAAGLIVAASAWSDRPRPAPVPARP